MHFQHAKNVGHFASLALRCVQALPDGILNNLVDMINFMKEGEFVKANDIYILTAIGNAPWPIGLTMVGIHERSGNLRVLVLHEFLVESASCPFS